MTISSEDLQRYIRCIVYALAGALIQYGAMSSGMTETFAGIATLVLNFLWTLWGNRLLAKINELGKIAQDPNSPVSGVITTPTEKGVKIADQTPATVAIAGTPQAHQIAGAPPIP